jgi:translocator protein
MNTPYKLFISILGPLLVGVIGSLFTFQSIPVWYAGLAKPKFSPPNWVFGPVWTVLYILMGCAAFLVWRRGLELREVRLALSLFIGQLVLNALWSIIFFGFHNPGLAFIEIIFLLIAIVATIVSFAHVSKTAAWLLVPYIVWVSFASYLNFAIWMLN